jgi:hypothetical protein
VLLSWLEESYSSVSKIVYVFTADCHLLPDPAVDPSGMGSSIVGDRLVKLIEKYSEPISKRIKGIDFLLGPNNPFAQLPTSYDLVGFGLEAMLYFDDERQ